MKTNDLPTINISSKGFRSASQANEWNYRRTLDEHRNAEIEDKKLRNAGFADG